MNDKIEGVVAGWIESACLVIECQSKIYEWLAGWYSRRVGAAKGRGVGHSEQRPHRANGRILTIDTRSSKMKSGTYRRPIYDQHCADQNRRVPRSRSHGRVGLDRLKAGCHVSRRSFVKSDERSVDVNVPFHKMSTL